MNQQINILMTGGGAPGAAGILRCLQQDASLRVIAADADPGAVGRYLATRFETIPAAGDPSFASSLLAFCIANHIHVLMPLVTRELLPLAQQLDQFEAAGTKLLVSSPAALAVANDKSRLYQVLEAKGIRVPAFRVVNGDDAGAGTTAFRRAIQELGYPAKTICFKPSFSNGSRGFRIMAASIDEHDLLFNQKPDSTYISFSDAERILSGRSFPQLLVSEFLPGEEYSVDCLANQGIPVLIVPRLRKKMRAGISVEGEFIKDESIIRYCATIIEVLQLHGNIGIQVKRAMDGTALLLEINPRVQGTIVAGLGAGINLPLLAVKQALGLPILPGELEVGWGVRFSRYWREVFY